MANSGKRKERKIRRPKITVIGEGLTERWYFDHLRKIKGYHYDCKPRFFNRQSYEEMGKLIEKVRENGGVAVCVCDADITRNNSDESKRLKELKARFSKDSNVLICDSMPSIEFWFLIHYINTSKHFQDSKAVIHELRKFLSNYDKNIAFLGKLQWVEEICSDQKLEKACERASALNSQSESYSEIHKAIQLFEEK